MVNNNKSVKAYNKNDIYRELKDEGIIFQEYPIKAKCKTFVEYCSSENNTTGSDSESDDSSVTDGFTFESDNIDAIVFVTKNRLFIYNFDTQSTLLNMHWDDPNISTINMNMKTSDNVEISLDTSQENSEQNSGMTVNLTSSLANNIVNHVNQFIPA